MSKRRLMLSMQKKNFLINPSESAEENFDRFTEVFSQNRVLSPVDTVTGDISAIRGYWIKLTEEEKWKFLEVCKEKETYIEQIQVEGSHPFRKATDTQLQQAAKFINESNVSQLATKYLRLTLQEIDGRDVFNVLKL